MNLDLRLAPKLFILLLLTGQQVQGFNLITPTDAKAVVTGSTEDLQLQIDRLNALRDEFKKKFNSNRAALEKSSESVKSRLAEAKAQLAKHQSSSQQKFLNKN